MFWHRGSALFIGLSLVLGFQVSSSEQDTPPDKYGWVANIVIWGQQPVFWLARKTLYPEMSLKTAEIEGETYSYLIRKGERKGVLILLHGIMSRKDHYMPMVHHLVKMKKPLPTIIAVDLMGHGSHSYPADYDFSIERFTWHTARFIRHIQQKKADEPVIILGHSLGGGIAALLRPLENISATALILISPVGIGTPNTTDLKSQIETARGLPFDYGSASICQMLEVPFEDHLALTSAVLKTGCFIYSFLNCPYETWMKNRMFANLAVSEQLLLSDRSAREFIETHFYEPIYLVWTRSDRMFDASRYTDTAEYIVNSKRGECFEFEGSHLWFMEHPDQAAGFINSLIDRVILPTAYDNSPAHPVYLFLMALAIRRLIN